MIMQNNNKRIAKNTVIIYLQLFVSMAVSLVSSRLVLQTLGASDYGLYNVVGGVIAMLAFISSSQLVTTVRFLNYEMGKPGGDVNRVFNKSLMLHTLIALLIFVLLESLGVFYILNYLNVDIGKEADAMFVFQVSTVVACISVVFVPFQSLFAAHERFVTIAVVEIVCAFVKLALVCLLFVYSGNALRFYALAMGFVTLMSFAIYYFLSHSKWPSIVKICLVREWRSYKDQLFFSNWNLLDAAAMVVRAQGAALLINLFFGTVVNAAYAIANTVLQQVNTFVGKFDIAVAPQITQNIGAGNEERSVKLASFTCRISVLLMEIIFFSLFIELEFILRLWLGDNLPAETVTLCQYTLLVALVSSTSSGLFQLINGLGKIKWFKIQKSAWYGLSILVGYVLFKWGYPPYFIVLLFVVSDILCRICQFCLLKTIYSMEVKSFIYDAYKRPAVVFLILALLVACYKTIGEHGFWGSLLGIASTLFISFILAVTIGLNDFERKTVVTAVRQRLSFK